MSRNAAYLVLINSKLDISDKLKIFHYLYLNGIDIHLITMSMDFILPISYYSIYSFFRSKEVIIPYLRVISQDFDYLHNQHDNILYKKPSFWKEIDNNIKNNNLNNNLNNLNNCANEQSKQVNEWKNRFEEHVLRKLSKMVQQHMLE